MAVLFVACVNCTCISIYNLFIVHYLFTPCSSEFFFLFLPNKAKWSSRIEQKEEKNWTIKRKKEWKSKKEEKFSLLHRSSINDRWKGIKRITFEPQSKYWYLSHNVFHYLTSEEVYLSVRVQFFLLYIFLLVSFWRIIMNRKDQNKTDP